MDNYHSRQPALPNGWSAFSDHSDPYREYSSRSGSSVTRPNFKHSPKYTDRYGQMSYEDTKRKPNTDQRNGWSEKSVQQHQHYPDKPNGVSAIQDETKSQIKTSKGGGVSRVLSKYAEKTSLNGVPFISASKNPYVKAIWSLLLAAAIGAMTYHLYSLLSNFLEYKKHTKVGLNYSNLQFPAITICNINILRKSKLNETPDEIQEYAQKMDPDEMMGRIRNCNYSEDDEDGCFDEINNGENNDTYDVDDSWFDQVYPDSWESEGQNSNFNDVFDNFRDMIYGLPLEKRKIWGHQIEDMLVHCSFAGKKCSAKNFTHVFSGTYGNCYTLQYEKFFSRKSGPDGGLELVVFLENHEYIEGITTGKGIHVVIHELKTLPFPDDEGIAISPATQTILGMKQVQIERLGFPYGSCKAVNFFEKKYNVTYTRNTCQKICQQNLIRKTCNCTDGKSPNLNDIMGDVMGMEPCKSAEQIKCYTKVTFDFDSKNNSCDCDDPCSERVFEQSISSRQWPNWSFSPVLVETVCKNISIDTCDMLKAQLKDSPWEVMENFIKLNIYYNDLNYELLTDSPDYEMVNLWSDIGGTIGLWIGLSVLGVCELLMLLAQVIIKCCNERRDPKARG